LPWPFGTATFSADVAHGAGPAWDGVAVGESAGLAVPGDTVGVPVTAGEESGEAAGVDEVPQAATRAAEQARTAAAAKARAALADDVIVGVPPAVAPVATQL
jgi:hypothetical protein